MLEMITPLAFGPIGGIDGSVAVFWATVWTIILGGMLYGSMVFFPQWVDMSDVEDSSGSHH